MLARLENGEYLGLADSLSNYHYHSLNKYFSSSQLKYIYSTSPAHFKAKFIDKTLPKEEPSNSQKLGSLLHCLLLEPQALTREFLVLPELNLKTKDGREEKARLIAESPMKTVVDIDQVAEAQAMAESVLLNKEAVDLLKRATFREQSFFWRCPYSDLLFKAKVDAHSKDTLIEIKTSVTSEPEKFSRQVHEYDYDLSVVHYMQGMKVLLDKVPEVHFIVIENKGHYNCEVHDFKGAFLETGHAKWLNSVDKLSRCMKENKWPGYGRGELVPPAWAMRVKGDSDGV